MKKQFLLELTRLDRPEDLVRLLEILKSLQTNIEIGTPASATALGVKDTIKYDDSYIYICVATNTWKRAALSSW